MVFSWPIGRWARDVYGVSKYAPPLSPLTEYFDWVAVHDERARRIQAGFHRQVASWHRRQIEPGKAVLEWGSGAGDLLAAVAPERGLGLDASERMIEKARERHAGNPALQFRRADVLADDTAEQFDYVVMSFLIGYLPDVQRALERQHAVALARTRLVITSLNHLWQQPLRLAQRCGWVTPQPESNWLTTDDLVNLLELSGWEVVSRGTMQLLPFDIPLLTPLCNRFLVRLPLLRWLGISLTLVARPVVPPRLCDDHSVPSCSVIIPMRNEAGNVRAALERVPVLGWLTEIVFVEGNSTDDTWEVLQREVAAYRGPHRVRLLRQPGKGKWDAVRTGFAEATGEILVIQDGDLTAPPEDLPKFYEAIVSGRAEFANGSRLVYPMEKQAMRFLNFLGNKFFALALSHVLGQPVKDSLCGTKMLLRRDYQRLLKRIESFGDFDPFGDFNLLFGASLLNLKIRDIPVRYRDRTYGETNISRFRHGWILLRMTWFGLRKLRWT